MSSNHMTKLSIIPTLEVDDLSESNTGIIHFYDKFAN